MSQEEILPTTCPVCQGPVEPDRYGRPRQFHPECRRQWRSEQMAGNKNARGKRTVKDFPVGQADEAKAAAYRACEPDSIRTVAQAYWGELARFTYWCYDKLNPLCFGGRVAHPLFQFARVMPYGACVGLSHTSDLDRPVIDVFLSLWTRGKHPHAAVLGVIAHELLHFYCGLRWRDAGKGWHVTSHQNEWWPAEVKRISPLLRVDLKRMEEPYEAWPDPGWSAPVTKELDAALRAGQFFF